MRNGTATFRFDDVSQLGALKYNKWFFLLFKSSLVLIVLTSCHGSVGRY